jgi:hypothetical protein
MSNLKLLKDKYQIVPLENNLTLIILQLKLNSYKSKVKIKGGKNIK